MDSSLIDDAKQERYRHHILKEIVRSVRADTIRSSNSSLVGAKLRRVSWRVHPRVCAATFASAARRPEARDRETESPAPPLAAVALEAPENVFAHGAHQADTATQRQFEPRARRRGQNAFGRDHGRLFHKVLSCLDTWRHENVYVAWTRSLRSTSSCLTTLCGIWPRRTMRPSTASYDSLCYGQVVLDCAID